MNIISLEKCKEYFYYDLDGNLYWNVDRGGNKKGNVVKCLKTDRYFRVQFDGKYYRQHRILYQLYNNIELDPSQEIDHVDGNRHNNSFENLRICTRSENARNIKVQKNNLSTGIKNIGIRTIDNRKYFILSIMKNKKSFVKYFNAKKYTLQDVIDYRDEMLQKLHEEFASFR